MIACLIVVSLFGSSLQIQSKKHPYSKKKAVWKSQGRIGLRLYTWVEDWAPDKELTMCLDLGAGVGDTLLFWGSPPTVCISCIQDRDLGPATFPSLGCSPEVTGLMALFSSFPWINGLEVKDARAALGRWLSYLTLRPLHTWPGQNDSPSQLWPCKNPSSSKLGWIS